MISQLSCCKAKSYCSSDVEHYLNEKSVSSQCWLLHTELFKLLEVLLESEEGESRNYRKRVVVNKGENHRKTVAVATHLGQLCITLPSMLSTLGRYCIWPPILHVYPDFTEFIQESVF